MIVLSAAVVAFMLSSAVLAHGHVPLESWNQCPSDVTNPPARFAPLPTFNSGIVGSPVTAWPAVGSYNFCAYMDTIYCQLKPLVAFLAEIEEYADLMRCLYADINGPLDELADPPITGNDMLDGLYEMALLARVLNDVSHPLHADAHAAVQTNFIFFKNTIQQALADEGYLTLAPLVAPYLIGSLGMMLAGYAALGDEQTYAALDALLFLLSDIGLAPPPGGVVSVTDSIPTVGPYEDYDGDGFPNIDEYMHVRDNLGLTVAKYMDYVLNPPSLAIAGAKYYQYGTTIRMSPSLRRGGIIETVAWEKNGVPVGTGTPLEITNAAPEHQGEYLMTITHRMGPAKAIVEDTATGTVTLGDTPIPLSGLAGLVALSGAIALAAALRMKRRK